MSTRSVYRRIVTSLIAGGLVVAACGPAVASNMSFRYQVPIVFAGPGNIGNHWVALPFFSPYVTAADLCTLTGLTSTGFLRASIAMINPSTGVATSANCGTAAAAAMSLVPGRCVRIRQPAVATAPTSILLVGSHDPALAVTIPDAGVGNIGTLWYAIPWHTTAQNVNNLCTQQGLTSTGLGPRASCLQMNPSNGFTSIVNCGTAAAAIAMPDISRCCRFREPNGPITWVAPTY